MVLGGNQMSQSLPGTSAGITAGVNVPAVAQGTGLAPEYFIALS